MSIEASRRRPTLINTRFNDGFDSEKASESITLSPSVPTFVVSQSEDALFEKPPSSTSWPQTTPKVNSRRNESRKLLAHVLDQLRNREMPPSVFDALTLSEEAPNERGLGALVGAVKEAARMKPDSRFTTNAPANTEDDNDEEGQGGYSTDATFDLMTQLRDVLIISVSRGWHIFEDR